MIHFGAVDYWILLSVILKKIYFLLLLSVFDWSQEQNNKEIYLYVSVVYQIQHRQAAR